MVKSRVIPSKLSATIWSSMSFKNIENRIGDKLSPCRTPQFVMKKEEDSLFTETHDLMLLYIYLRNKETQQSIQFIVRIPCNVNR